jgi:uncharacterized protein (DUF1800 family)
MTDIPFAKASLMAAGCALCLLVGCATSSHDSSAPSMLGAGVSQHQQPDNLQILNRITWGANASLTEQVGARGLDRYIQSQLHPNQPILPEPVQQQIAAMTIAQRPLDQLVQAIEQRRNDVPGLASDDEKIAARRSYQQELNRLAHEAATRSLLRALYSPNQLQEQMTWFWMNHFSVHQNKRDLRVMIGDYEDRAIRPHALGKFRDLLKATVHHPAMLRYLDNERNAVNRINENYARELMELHTLGVNGGYSQLDVQELARILTGVGINTGPAAPKVRGQLQTHYVRQGLFEFNPNRHDYGDKQLLGQVIRGRGLAELDEAIDRLSRHPSTARFISRKLAIFLVSDDPPAPLVERLAQTFLQHDGDIAATLRVLFNSAEFRQSLGHKFKDPVHYVISAVRLAYDDQPILNAVPMLNWLNRMGQPLYGRQTPDGYPMTQAAWASSGQLTTRFEIAKAIGSGSARLFRTDSSQPQERIEFAQLADARYVQLMQKSLGSATRRALEQAASPQEWNTLLLSSPEMMSR